MTRTGLKDVIVQLDGFLAGLQLAMPETDPQIIGERLQRMLDLTQQRLDDARKDG